MKKKRIFLIIFCLIIITSTVLIYNHNKTKVTPTEANIQKVQSEKNSSQNNVRNNKNSKNNSGNKEVLEEEGKMMIQKLRRLKHLLLLKTIIQKT